MSLKAKVEAVLFASGAPLSVAEIVSVVGEQENKVLETIKLIEDGMLQDGDSGICIRQVNDKYYITTKPEHTEMLTSLYSQGRPRTLTQAGYETLAVIAYNQPVTRAQVDSVRGASSDSHIQRLIDRELVEVTGYLDAPGRPSLLCTTEKFLKEFGLKNVSELPPMELLMYSSLQELEKRLQEAGGNDGQISLENITSE